MTKNRLLRRKKTSFQQMTVFENLGFAFGYSNNTRHFTYMT